MDMLRRSARKSRIDRIKNEHIKGNNGTEREAGHYGHSFIHLVVCITTGPKPLPKPALHIVRSRASCFK
jgi:hypothetical protein